MLLYSIRKRDRDPGTMDAAPGTDALLQSPHHAGGEAAASDPFRSFHNVRDYDEDDDKDDDKFEEQAASR